MSFKKSNFLSRYFFSSFDRVIFGLLLAALVASTIYDVVLLNARSEFSIKIIFCRLTEVIALQSIRTNY